jgi:hypothetical protein
MVGCIDSFLDDNGIGSVSCRVLQGFPRNKEMQLKVGPHMFGLRMDVPRQRGQWL